MRDAVEVPPRPRVAALEWLDPVFIGGHWVPQMIELAGGEDVLGMPGEKSRTASGTSWRRRAPEVVVAMPCGYDLDGAVRDEDQPTALDALGARVVAVDAAAYFSRPGPRLVDGVELLARLLHPDRVADAATSSVRPGCLGRGRKRAELQIVIDASPKQCFEALVDVRDLPGLAAAVRECEVLSRDGERRGKEVSFEIDAKVRTVSYTLDYSYEEPHLITWRYVEGDVRDVDGEFVFEDRGDGTTLATYALRLDPGVPLPGDP